MFRFSVWNAPSPEAVLSKVSCSYPEYEFIWHMNQNLCNHSCSWHNSLNIWFGTDAMASNDTHRRLIKDNKKRPRDPNVLVIRRTVSARSPSSDLKCPMQIIIFLGQDDRYYLSTKSFLNHRHHLALKADAILRGQNDMEQGDLDLLLLFFSVNATGVQISQIKAWRVLKQHISS